jgi:hypothetical protein
VEVEKARLIEFESGWSAMHDEDKETKDATALKSYRPQRLRVVWPLLVLALLNVAQGYVAVGQQPVSKRFGESLQGPSDALGSMDPKLARRQILLLDIQRQKTMVSDTDKLLELATELKSEIDSGDSASLSPEQLHKIAEIEKLARSVRQKMTITIGGGPALHDTFIP